MISKNNDNQSYIHYTLKINTIHSPPDPQLTSTHRRSTRLLQKNSRTLGINTLLKQPRIIRSPSTNQRTSWLSWIGQITDRCSKDGAVFGGGVISPFFEFGSTGSGGAAAEEPWFDDVV